MVPLLLGSSWADRMDDEDKESFVHDSVTSYLCSPLLVILYALTVKNHTEKWL